MQVFICQSIDRKVDGVFTSYSIAVQSWAISYSKVCPIKSVELQKDCKWEIQSCKDGQLLGSIKLFDVLQYADHL